MDNWLSYECTACGACVSACPKDAITLESINGFYQPIINNTICINCEVCKKTCPLVNKIEKNNTPAPQVWAAQNKDLDSRLNSTSGGIFSLLAETVLTEGGVVFGAEYQDNHTVKHNCIVMKEEIPKLRQSKYVESYMGTIFRDVKKDLITGKKVLFSGTPCQIGGLYSYLGKPYEELITVDFICRGSNSTLVYQKWLEDLEKQYNSKVVKVWFKNKELGWNDFSTRVEFENGAIYRKDRYTDQYMIGYLKDNLYIRSSCGDCQYKSLPRIGDLTLADFWGIDKSFDDDRGTSMILVNNAKGQALFEQIKEKCYYKEENIDTAKRKNPMLYKSVKINKKKVEFIALLNQYPYGEAYKIIKEKYK